MKTCSRRILPGLVVLLAGLCLTRAVKTDFHPLQPLVTQRVAFGEENGLLVVEAEHFLQQTLTNKRAWYLSTSLRQTTMSGDADPPHIGGASGGAYVECLPDTRHHDQHRLADGENVSNEPGRLALLHYQVHFARAGRYYVWARAFSTGDEDNGLHVGLNGEWPESGRHMQWCEGRNTWRWESLQRTEANPCGEPHRIHLDIPRPGIHVVMFSMREDGFEFDKWLMTTNREMERPLDVGPASFARSGEMPAPFAYVEPGGSAPAPATPAPVVRSRGGDGSVAITGEPRQWHKITLTQNGPFARESDTEPNPFVDYRMTVTFTHGSGSPQYRVPGYFAADGNAAETSADAGTQWRAHLAPDKPGRWTYRVSFVEGRESALRPEVQGQAVIPYDGAQGAFTVGESDKSGRDLRGKGRLTYVGRHHLRFSQSGEYFLKAGADAPETLLAYADFDGAMAGKSPLKTWRPHVQDWRPGDPLWQKEKGRGLIGALNYLAGKGCNAFSFLTYNAGGDGDNVWPFVSRDDKLHYDCSRLDQWQVVFDHAQGLGLHLHFKLQEQENDDNRRGDTRQTGHVPASLDDGGLGPARRLYCRELIARFGHELALNWNLGEENTQSTEEQLAMARYLRDLDPYDHPIVVHTFPGDQDKVYPPLLGQGSDFTGASLQNHWDQTHQRTLQWVAASAGAGRPWVVANDEQGPANLGVPPDPGYQEFNGTGKDGKPIHTLHDIRRATLWGNLMAGGAGVEYYFGYDLPGNDLLCEDWRSRDQSWDYCRIALEFFRQGAPFWEMTNANALVGNATNDNRRYCLAKAGEVYLVYLAEGGTAELDLSGAKGTFQVRWFNPREGGPLAEGSVRTVSGGATSTLGEPPGEPREDWLVVVKRKPAP